MVRESAEQNNISRVNKISLVIGRLAMVLPDSLEFCFQALSSQEEMFKDAALEIEDRETVIKCLACEQQFTLDEGLCLVCPGCGSSDVVITGGKELYLNYYEGD